MGRQNVVSLSPRGCRRKRLRDNNRRYTEYMEIHRHPSLLTTELNDLSRSIHAGPVPTGTFSELLRRFCARHDVTRYNKYIKYLST